jgi:DNA-binding response OmpR family regulator
MGYRALVVDDQVPLAEVVTSYLEREQFEALVADNGVDAIAVAREFDTEIDTILGLTVGADGGPAFCKPPLRPQNVRSHRRVASGR